MGKIKKHIPVKFFVGLTFNPELAVTEIVEEISKNAVDIDYKSNVFNFDEFTNYYQSEMGKGLKKIFLSFKPLLDVEYLPEFKIKTNKLEQQFVIDGNRHLNIDPGYLTQAKIVLATTKDYSHRLYLKDGIFGDLHLVFANKNYQSQPWTYPDYKSNIASQFFLGVRKIYREQLAGLNTDPFNKT